MSAVRSGRALDVYHRLAVFDDLGAPGPYLRRPGEPGVRARRVRDRDDLVDQVVDLNRAAGQELEEADHVALLGPPYVADRVVKSPLLVLAVIPARPVRARHAEAQFLAVQ